MDGRWGGLEAGFVSVAGAVMPMEADQGLLLGAGWV